jgi:hypothetical protein
MRNLLLIMLLPLICVRAEAAACTLDIGYIKSDQGKKQVIDYYKSQRTYDAPYVYYTQNAALFYGNHICQNITKGDVLAGMNAFETYFTKYQSDFMVKPSNQLLTTKFAMYLLQSGLNPFPPDPQQGVVGYSNGEIMGLLPDVFKSVSQNNDPNVIIHELGHVFFRIPQKNVWLAEGLAEFAIHFYLPKYSGIYEATKNFIFTHTNINIFGTQVKENHKYDIGAFWAYFANSHGGARAIGSVATSAFNGNQTDVWHIIAAYINTNDADLIVDWVSSLLQVNFWKTDQTKITQARLYLKNSPLDPSNLVWSKTTISTIDFAKLKSSVEKGGFQVAKWDGPKKTLSSTTMWRYLYITQYTDGSATVTKKDTITIGKRVKGRFCVIIRVS